MKRQNLRRTVHLGVYGAVGEKIIKAAIKYGRDSNQAATRLDRESFRAVETNRAPDNEILLDVYEDNTWDHPLTKTVFTEKSSKRKDDAAVREWLAGCVKGIAKLKLGSAIGSWNIHKAEIAKNDEWRRDSALTVKIASSLDAESADSVFGVPHVYALYEALKGRSPKASRFPAGVVAEAVGEPFDPVRTEIETFRREEAKRIEAEFKAANEAVSKWHSDEYSRLESETKARREKAKAEYAEKLAKMNAELDASLAGLTLAPPAQETPSARAA